MSAKCVGNITKRQWVYRLLLVTAAYSVEFLVNVKPHHVAALSGGSIGDRILLAEIHVEGLVVVLALLGRLTYSCIRANLTQLGHHFSKSYLSTLSCNLRSPRCGSVNTRMNHGAKSKAIVFCLLPAIAARANRPAQPSPNLLISVLMSLESHARIFKRPHAFQLF